MYILYKTTNTINNKIYIGIHKTESPNTFDGYYGSGVALKKAIKKYGKKYFTRKTLYIFDDKKQAYVKETEIVNSSFIQSNNYNMNIGGYGGSYKLSENTKQKIRNSLKGKMSGSKNPMYNKKGEKHPAFNKGKIIQQYTKNKILIKEGTISKFVSMGFSISMIYHCVAMKHYYHKGFIFKYKEDQSFVFPNKKIKGKWKTKLKGADKIIQQYNLNKELIAENTAYLFAQNSNFTQGQITKCCKGKINTHKGFFWKYKDNNRYIFPKKSDIKPKP